MNFNDKNNNGKIQNFIKSTKTFSPTGFSGATSLHPIGISFMYTEASSKKRGNNVFFSSERTDIIQLSNITFYYNRFSFLTNDCLKSVGRCKIHLLLEYNTWSTIYNIPKDDIYSGSPTQGLKLSLNFTEEKHGIKLKKNGIKLITVLN